MTTQDHTEWEKEFDSKDWRLNTAIVVEPLEKRLDRELTKDEINNSTLDELIGTTTLAQATLEPIKSFIRSLLAQAREEAQVEILEWVLEMEWLHGETEEALRARLQALKEQKQ